MSASCPFANKTVFLVVGGKSTDAILYKLAPNPDAVHGMTFDELTRVQPAGVVLSLSIDVSARSFATRTEACGAHRC